MDEARRINKEIVLNALLYIASKAERKDYYNVLKIMYFADLHHLENYGSLIADETYRAMKSGPVPSLAYDIVKAVKDGWNCSFSDDDILKLKEAFALDGYKIIPCKGPDYDFFSKASLESLDYAIRTYGNLPGPRLKALSHDEAYKSAGLDDIITVEAMAKKFKNSELLDYLRNPYP